MAHTVVAAIEQLRTLNVVALQKKYQQIFGDASKSSNKQYLFRRIAWRLQANAEGGLSERACHRALQIADEADLRTRAPKGFLSAQVSATATVDHPQPQRDARLPASGFTQTTLRNLLTNAIYAGKVEHKGTIYPGEHAAIIEASLWEELNAEIGTRRGQRSDLVRTSQNALLGGLLFCQSCGRPMIATYTTNGGRRFRYYVCQAARQNGWDWCPTKSVAAVLIEDTVVAQLRTTLSGEETRQKLQITETDWGCFLEGDHRGLVVGVVEHIGYDGKTGAVTVKLGSDEQQS